MKASVVKKVLKDMPIVATKLVQGILGKSIKLSQAECKTCIQFMTIRDDIIDQLKARNGIK